MRTGTADAYTLHNSGVIGTSFLLSDYDANITALNKETIPVTETREIALSFTKERESMEVLFALRSCQARVMPAERLLWPANAIT